MSQIVKDRHDYINIILENIPSADMRKFLRDNNWNPSIWDIATIICNLDLPYRDELDLLKELSCSIVDHPLRLLLCAEIQERQSLLDSFEQFDRQLLYVLHWKTDDGHLDFGGIFDRYDDVSEYASRELQAIKKTPQSTDVIGYEIERNKIIRANSKHGDELPIAVQKFDSDGNLIYCWNSEMVHVETTAEGLSDRYVHIPHPFKTGDLVRISGTSHFGTVDYDSEAMQRLEDRHNKGEIRMDWFDATVTVVYRRDENGYTDHDHINPMYLEYSGYQVVSPAVFKVKKAVRDK